MPTKIASLYAEIGANTKNFDDGAKKVKGELVDLKKGMGDASSQLLGFSSMTGLVTVGLVGLAGALYGSVKAAAEAQKVDAQLTAVLRSTGGAAGMTKGELDDLATSLTDLSTFDDEAIKSSEALLLTFTAIGQDVFPQAQQAILDIATAMGGDLQSATIQVGKALNDPIQGMSALQRVGVSFSEDQKKVIKSLQETGKTMEAQKIIIAELNKEFGGSSQAALNTFDGKLQHLKASAENLGEAFGGPLLGPLSDSMSILSGEIKFITELGGAFQSSGQQAAALTNPLDQIALALRTVQNLAAEVVRTTETGTFDKWMDMLTGKSTDLPSAIRNYQGMAEAFSNIAGGVQGGNDEAKDYAQTLSSILGYAQELGDYQDERADKELELYKARKQGYSEWGTKIKGIKDEIADLDKAHHDAMIQWISDAYQAQLASDGVLDDKDMKKVLDYQLAMGLLSQQEYAAALQALALKAALESMPKNINITVTEWLNLKQHGYTGSGAGNPGSSTVTGIAGGGDLVKGGWSLVGDMPGGQPTAYSELIGPDGHVYNADETRAILKSGMIAPRALSMGGPGYGDDPIGLPTTPQQVAYNQQWYANQTATVGGGGGGGAARPTVKAISTAAATAGKAAQASAQASQTTNEVLMKQIETSNAQNQALIFEIRALRKEMGRSMRDAVQSLGA